jgi:hypothetical protein
MWILINQESGISVLPRRIGVGEHHDLSVWTGSRRAVVSIHQTKRVARTTSYVTFFMFQFFKFYLSTLPSCFTIRTQPVSFLVLLPAIVL